MKSALAGIALSAIASSAMACGVPATFPCQPVSFDPTDPAASGYRIVFADDFLNSSTIDMADSGAAGFHWYRRWWFQAGAQPAGDIVTGAGGLVLTPSLNAGPNLALTTAVRIGGAGQHWAGTTFGGGYYAEVSMSFDGPAIVAANFLGSDGQPGWPAFWAESINFLVPERAVDAQWPGQVAGYTHFIEDDMFEYDNTGDVTHKWGSGIWDWSGISGASSCSGYTTNGPNHCGILNLNNIGTNQNTAFLCASASCPTITWNVSTFHTLGHLWVAGDANNAQTGFIQTFFDGNEARANNGALSSKTTWVNGTMPAPASLPNSPRVWSIHDTPPGEKVAVILGAGAGQAFHIKFVRIWQIPGCGQVYH